MLGIIYGQLATAWFDYVNRANRRARRREGYFAHVERSYLDPQWTSL